MSRQTKRLAAKQARPDVPLKRGRGRPATGNDPMIAFRMPVELRKEIEAWAAGQPDKPPRSEAMRRLMKLGLSVSNKHKPRRY